MPPGAEVVQRPDGTLTAGQAPGAAEPTPKANIKLTKDAQSALQSLIDQALGMVEDAQAMVKKAKVVEEPAEQDFNALVEVMSQVSESFEDALEALGGQLAEAPTEAAPEGAAPPAPAAAAAGAPTNPQPPASAPMSMGLGKRLDLLRAERTVRKAKFEKTMGALVQKRGARMAKERLARFKSAIGILSSLLSELDAAETMAEQTKAASTPAPAPAAPGPVADVQVAKLAKQVGELQELLKKQSEDTAALRAQRASSNAITVEKSTPPEVVSWPRDMNRPFTKNIVGRDSFFGSVEADKGASK